MSDVLPFTDPGTAGLYRTQIERIRKLWKEHLVLPEYCHDRFAERGIEIADVRHVIFYGRIIHHEPAGDLWRYTVKGKSIDGHPMKCVVDVNGKVVVVTVFCL